MPKTQTQTQRMIAAVRRWWDRLTLPQAALAIAVLVGLYLIRDQLPQSIETWKQAAVALGEVLVSLGVVGSLLHGRETGDRATDAPSPARGRPEVPPPAAMLLVAIAAATASQGCGSAVAAYARAGTVMTIALEGADDLAETAALAAIESCPDIDCTVQVEHATEVADVAIASTRLALEVYLRAVELALAGGGDADVVAALGLGIGRLVLRWNELVPLLVPLGATLPPIPPWVALLAGGSS